MPTLSPGMMALLDTIASTEAPGYNVIYGGSTFNDYSRHPGQYVPIASGPNQGKTSSAAGRYQFLNSTWDDIASRYGIPDFSPKSQDFGAAMLATEVYRRKTGRDIEADLATGDPAVLADIGRTLAGTWTSLPSGIEQGQGIDRFTSTYMTALSNPTAGGDYNASISAQMAAASREAGTSANQELAMIRAQAPDPFAPDIGPLSGASLKAGPAPFTSYLTRFSARPAPSSSLLT